VNTLDVGYLQTDWLGTHNFKLVATDSFTGLINDEVIEEITLHCQVTSMSYNKDDFPEKIAYMPGLSGIK